MMGASGVQAEVEQMVIICRPKSVSKNCSVSGMWADAVRRRRRQCPNRATLTLLVRKGYRHSLDARKPNAQPASHSSRSPTLGWLPPA